MTTDLAKKIEAQGIYPTGKDGEFHTLIINGPNFSVPMSIYPKDLELLQGGKRTNPMSLQVVGDWGERRLHGCKEVEQRRSSCRVQPMR